MNIRFRVNAHTVWGQEVYVSGGAKELGQWDADKAVKLSCVDIDIWEVKFKIKTEKPLDYKYLIKDEHGAVLKEFGANRTHALMATSDVEIIDTWRYTDSPENNLFSSPFYKSFFKREKVKKTKQKTLKIKAGSSVIRFQIRAPRVGKNYSVGVLGSEKFLGAWDPEKVVVMDGSDYPIWSVDVEVKSLPEKLEYKYVIVDNEMNSIVIWDQNENRVLRADEVLSQEGLIIRSDEYFAYPDGGWKAAGTAIPVFSIRTEDGAGVGEFPDIKKMIDWSAKTGMKVLQILPVNDTVASHTWVDSYPYAAISVHALHPMYASMKAMGQLKDKKLSQELNIEAQRLNALPEVDYEAVMKLKSKFFKYSFDDNKLKFLNSRELSSFIKQNKSWIIAYAVFSFLRDKHGTPDFSQWGDEALMSDEELLAFAAPDQPHYDDIAVHYYIQFHLDKQLKDATEYAREQGVVLKGDIPIGIFRHSVDAWRWPHLFHMENQAGAPPDDFSVTGQNWGFPTYNWEAMAAENYSWWKSRMIKMAEYFDVFRIDHILGFFRIWEMPPEAVEGIMGRFNPALPFHVSELEANGIHFDYDRMCKPFLPAQIIHDIFGSNAEFVFQNFLDEKHPGMMNLKEEFDAERKIKNHLDAQVKMYPEKAEFYEHLRHQIYRLPAEVIFIEAPDSNGCYNPRIGMHSTYSYQWLSEDQKQKLDRLYNHYFYHRHNDFWKDSAMQKLPMLKDATDMLICGEDLGMVPACVPGVMNELQILSLAVQRMTNDDRGFWHPSDVPYSYVTTTGSHDVSNLREWWLEDRDASQRFYNEILGFFGEAPEQCESWVVLPIIRQHLYSPAMLAVFPIQDILAMSDELKRDNCMEERINVPAIIPHYWKYRLHISVEKLLEADSFNESLASMVDACGRSTDY
ncbi:MAG: 4-alpha-glucanotransferase [Cyclobacteriaceae bacterium]